MRSATPEPRGIASFRAIPVLGASILVGLPRAGLQAAVQTQVGSATAGPGAPGETCGAPFEDLNGDRHPDLFISLSISDREAPHVLINRPAKIQPWSALCSCGKIARRALGRCG